MEDVFHRLQTFPDRLETWLGGLEEGRLEVRPRTGVWSVKEILGHLSDTEELFHHRIQAILQQEGAPFEIMDQDAEVIRLGHGKTPLKELMDRFRRERSALLETVRSLAPQDWQRTGTHPKRGPMTIEALVRLLADHEDRHKQQMEERV